MPSKDEKGTRLAERVKALGTPLVDLIQAYELGAFDPKQAEASHPFRSSSRCMPNADALIRA